MKRSIHVTITISALLTTIILALLAAMNQTASAGSTEFTRYVAPGGNCGGGTPCYATVQAA